MAERFGINVLKLDLECDKDNPGDSDLSNILKVKTKCQVHGDQKVEYYCEEHLEFGCSRCFVVTGKHKLCQQIIILDDVDTEKTEDCKQVHKVLTNLEENVRSNIETVQKNKDIVYQRHETASRDVQQFRDKLISFIHSLANKQMKIIDKSKQDDLKKLEDGESLNRKISEQIQKFQQLYEASKADKAELFLTAKTILRETITLQDKLKDYRAKSVVEKFIFAINPELSSILECVAQLGELKDTRVTEMETGTDEVTDDTIEARCYTSLEMLGTLTKELEIVAFISVSRKIKLLHVLLVPVQQLKGDVVLIISLMKNALVSCVASHCCDFTGALELAVRDRKGGLGVELLPNEKYIVQVKLEAAFKYCIDHYSFQRKVTQNGVDISFSKTSPSTYIAGVNFKVV